MREADVSQRDFMKWFDSWNDLVTAAGLTPTDRSRIPDDLLFAEMLEVFLAEGGVVTQSRFGKISRYDLRPYRRFGGRWSAQLSSFREWLEANNKTFAYLDQLPALAPGRTSGLLSERSEEADALSHAMRRSVPLTAGRTYGPFLNFRGLQHAPINEQGVVFLFGIVAHELGYVVESVTSAFPDCEAKRRVGANWERVRIEFEFKSRNFHDHSHDPTGCDVIVCWEDNWPDAPCLVVELKTAIQGLDP